MDETKELQKKEAKTPETAERTRAGTIYSPAVDIVEKPASIILTADMPGVDASSIDISIENRVLTIYGRVSAAPLEGYRLVFSEYGVGDYERSFTLSDEIDSAGIEASVKNGGLTLVLPKAEKVKTRKIAVKTA